MACWYSPPTSFVMVHVYMSTSIGFVNGAMARVP